MELIKRPRRLRGSANLRKMVRETRMDKSSLIYPLFVLEGNGFVRLDNEEFEVKAGDSFIALPGVRHTMKTVDSEKPLKVFWFHSGI